MSDPAPSPDPEPGLEPELEPPSFSRFPLYLLLVLILLVLLALIPVLLFELLWSDFMVERGLEMQDEGL
jgi:hypothetical protein